MNIFKTFGPKLRVLLSIICGTKINLEWVTHPFLDLPPLPLCLTALPLILKFFQPPPPPPIIQYFEDSIAPICNWERGEGSNYDCSSRRLEILYSFVVTRDFNLLLKGLVTIRLNEIFPCLTC